MQYVLTGLNHAVFDYWQLQAYHQEAGNLPTGQPTARRSAAPSRPTPLDILGLNQNQNDLPQRTLAAEVELYLHDTQTAESLLTFWQVGKIWSILFVFPDLTFTGKPTSISNTFCSCHGHIANSRVSCPLWASIFIKQGDNDITKELHCTWAYGGPSSA